MALCWQHTQRPARHRESTQQTGDWDMPGGQMLQADSEGTEGQLAVCLLLSGARVL